MLVHQRVQPVLFLNICARFVREPPGPYMYVIVCHSIGVWIRPQVQLDFVAICCHHAPSPCCVPKPDKTYLGPRT